MRYRDRHEGRKEGTLKKEKICKEKSEKEKIGSIHGTLKRRQEKVKVNAE